MRVNGNSISLIIYQVQYTVEKYLDICLDNKDKFPYFCKKKMSEKRKKKKTTKIGQSINKKASQYTSPDDNRFSLVEEAGAGIPVSVVSDLIRITDLKKQYFANLLDISTKTLDRYQVQKKKLNPSGSELLLKLQNIYQKGTEIFNSIEAFRNWIEKPAYGLQRHVPKDLMQTITGIDLVMEELIRIESGYPV